MRERGASPRYPRCRSDTGAGWILLALLFSGGVFYFAGAQKGAEFLTGHLIEKSLSVDHIFVFVLLFTYFAVPPQYQHRVLSWGIKGALVMRGTMIVAGAALLEVFHWVIYVFGGVIIVSGVKMLVIVETTDLIFAVDSIPAIFAITRHPFIVYTSNVFAILGLRALYFLLAGVVRQFVYLKVGLSAVLVWVGTKMLLTDAHEAPTAASLGVVTALLATAVLASLVRTRWTERGQPVHDPIAPTNGSTFPSEGKEESDATTLRHPTESHLTAREVASVADTRGRQ